MASATRPSWSRPDRAGSTARTVAVEGDEPAAVAEAGGDRGEAHQRVHGVLDPRHVGDLAGHHPAVVEQEQHVLVALGAVGADHRLAGAGGGGPVDATHLVVDAVLAQLVELGAAAAALRRAQPDLEDAGPGDAQLGLLPAREGRDGRGAAPATASRRWRAPMPSGPSTRTTSPPISKRPRRLGRSVAVRAQRRRRRARVPRSRRVDGAQRRGQLVGQRDAQRAVGGVAHPPA